MVVARPVLRDDGQVLLHIGVELTQQYIEKLQEKGIPGVYIADEATDDIHIPETINPTVRQTAIKQVKNMFDSVQVGKTLDIGSINGSVNAIIDEIVNNSNVLVNLSEIRSYDGYTFAHSVNVCILAVIIGIKYKLNEFELRELALGAILHDIGKVNIPSHILNKQGKLTQHELTLIRNHSLFGWQMLRRNTDIPLLSAHIAFQHHEQPNGRGYPRHLVDEQIYIYAKIVSVADAYDAMTSIRVYRAAMLPYEALRLIKQLRGIQFNSEIAECLINCVAPYPVGSRVLLNTKEIGVVVDVNITHRNRPVVRLLFNSKRKRITNPFEVDLAKEGDIYIEKGLL